MIIKPFFQKSLILGVFFITGITLMPLELTLAADKLATSTQLNAPHGLVVDNHGNLYIADANNHRIRKVDNRGNMTTIAGNGIRGYHGDGGLAVNAQLNEPTAVALDNEGNSYIVDSKNHVVRKIDNRGIITTIVGNNTPGYSGDGGEAIFAKLNFPVDIVIDEAHNLYIADKDNHVIRKVDAAGVITTVAGDNTPGYRE